MLDELVMLLREREREVDALHAQLGETMAAAPSATFAIVRQRPDYGDLERRQDMVVARSQREAAGGLRARAYQSRRREGARADRPQLVGADHGGMRPAGRVEADDPGPVGAKSGSVLVIQERGRRQRTCSVSRLRRTWRRLSTIPRSVAAAPRLSHVHSAGASGRSSTGAQHPVRPLDGPTRRGAPRFWGTWHPACGYQGARPRLPSPVPGS